MLFAGGAGGSMHVAEKVDLALVTVWNGENRITADISINI